MRGVKAKRLRRQVYGDHSIREPRQYGRLGLKGGIVNVGRRSLYRALKKGRTSYRLLRGAPAQEVAEEGPS